MPAKDYTVIVQKITTEESSFLSYGLILTGYDGCIYTFNDISTNHTSVERLGNKFVVSDISELHFRDIIDDFIALEADAFPVFCLI